MRRPAILALFLFPALAWAPSMRAQDTVAPTTGETTLSARGENTGNYNVVQQWEFGYRFASVGGDDGKYRSDVNYGDGIRLLSSYLTVNSRDGHGNWFDEITLSTQGLGNDPYESANFRIQKNRWYRYDLLWRSNNYFNPGLTVADGEHLENTTYRLQDHDLTLFPQSWFRVRAGYSRTTQDGPALTTEQEFDPQGDVFPIFRDTREQYNEYRLAADIVLKSFRLSVLHRWEYFKDDTTDNLTATELGSPIDPSLLSGFSRAQPYRGRTQGWLVNLYAERQWIAANGRFTYAGGRGDFIQNESAVGVDRFGNPQNVQFLVTGNGDRPVISGDLNVTLFPASRLSVTNNTSVSNTRMIGSNSYEEFNNTTFTAQTLNFQFLGLLLITNSTDVRYRFSKKLDAFAGFRYSDRRIRSTEDEAAPASPFQGLSAEQSNRLDAGVAGVSWLPIQDLRVHLETEIGRNDHPFAPISDGNYNIIRTRTQYRKKNYTLGGGYVENYNNNSIAITAFSSHSRTYTGNASWNIKSGLSLDTSYSKLHLDTIGGVAFFTGSPIGGPISLINQESLYISNIHAGNLSLHFPVTAHADLYLGYNITKDTGDGRSSLAAQTTPVGQLLYNVQTFPLTYQSPMLRLSVKLTSKLRYNLGYQYYGYHEEFGLLSVNQSYRAHTGYTSLLWSF
ncbi:MAG TPA: hypothetical protein VHY84_21595 [Bryobacteraceae bacterium]|jgi:hypothetical protein|nr:hypothetical protein [Bryobacteraceae bacterium]